MNALDVVIALILAVSAMVSFRKGFSREIIRLTAAFVALFCGIWFYGSAGAFLLPYVSSPRVADFAGFALLFIAVLLLGSVVSNIVSRVLRTVGLSWFDRFLGGVFGLLRGLVASVALITGLVAFAPAVPGGAPPNSVINSRLAPYIIGISRGLMALAPREMKDGFQRRYERVKEAWQGPPHRELPKQDL